MDSSNPRRSKGSASRHDPGSGSSPDSGPPPAAGFGSRFRQGTGTTTSTRKLATSAVKNPPAKPPHDGGNSSRKRKTTSTMSTHRKGNNINTTDDSTPYRQHEAEEPSIGKPRYKCNRMRASSPGRHDGGSSSQKKKTTSTRSTTTRREKDKDINTADDSTTQKRHEVEEPSIGKPRYKCNYPMRTSRGRHTGGRSNRKKKPTSTRRTHREKDKDINTTDDSTPRKRHEAKEPSMGKPRYKCNRMRAATQEEINRLNDDQDSSERTVTDKSDSERTVTDKSDSERTISDSYSED